MWRSCRRKFCFRMRWFGMYERTSVSAIFCFPASGRIVGINQGARGAKVGEIVSRTGFCGIARETFPIWHSVQKVPAMVDLLRATWRYDENKDVLYVNYVWLAKPYEHDVLQGKGLAKNEGQWHDVTQEFSERLLLKSTAEDEVVLFNVGSLRTVWLSGEVFQRIVDSARDVTGKIHQVSTSSSHVAGSFQQVTQSMDKMIHIARRPTTPGKWLMH